MAVYGRADNGSPGSSRIFRFGNIVRFSLAVAFGLILALFLFLTTDLSLFVSPAVAAVFGGIMVKYQMLGPTGVLHLATTEMDVAGVAGARASDFQNGHLYRSGWTGAHAVCGGINQKYIQFGGPASALGLPITDEYSIPLPGGGRRSQSSTASSRGVSITELGSM